MREVFADAAYWIALANPRDQWAPHAKMANESFSDAIIVTTDEVLVEFLGHFSKSGEMLRSKAAAIVRAILDNPNVIVLPQQRATFLRGLTLYESREDKEYRLVDCISMEAMRERGLSEVLTGDRHFVQEGFVAFFLQQGLPE